MRKNSGSQKRSLMPDPMYKDQLVTKFVNNMMMHGKKEKAYGIFYDAIKVVEDKTSENGLEVWKKAVENVTPAVEVRSRRVGGATFQIPREIRPERRLALAMKWLIGYARKRNEHSMSVKLASEVVAAYKQEGAAYKKKEDTHRMAEANKAYSHFRF